MTRRTRARFRCLSVQMYQDRPKARTWYNTQPTSEIEMVWPRTFHFAVEAATGATSDPEINAFSKSTPTGEMHIQVDNPEVMFEPGKSYYVDITAVDEAE